jgi:AraC-like DNA-binding protein
LTLEEISALLGYTEGTNFRRAFKLWTGHPPSYFRPA